MTVVPDTPLENDASTTGAVVAGIVLLPAVEECEVCPPAGRIPTSSGMLPLLVATAPEVAAMGPAGGSSGLITSTPFVPTCRSKAIMAPRIGGSVAVPAPGSMVMKALPLMLTKAFGT